MIYTQYLQINYNDRIKLNYKSIKKVAPFDCLIRTNNELLFLNFKNHS